MVALRYDWPISSVCDWAKYSLGFLPVMGAPWETERFCFYYYFFYLFHFIIVVLFISFYYYCFFVFFFQLKDEVSSPGGTTIAGIQTLERSGLRSALFDAVETATKRATEIAEQGK